MREIEDRIGLSAYRHEEDFVGARLPDDACEIELRAGGLMLRARNPEADVEQLMAAGAIALKAMEYPRITATAIRSQHVVPLAAEFQSALASATPSVLGDWTDRVGLYDWSVLYDGIWKGRPYQVEFGIAAAAEMSFRLPGWASRLRDEGADRDEADPMEEPPAASLYVESVWSHSPDDDEGNSLNLETHYTEVIAAANEVVEAFMEMIGSEAS